MKVGLYIYITCLFLISNFHRVLNVVCFLLGYSPASEVYMPTFRNTLFHLHRQVKMEQTPGNYPKESIQLHEFVTTLLLPLQGG
jgi:hypothetical protein